MKVGDIGDDVPLCRPSIHNDFTASHLPVHVEGRVNCRVCYITDKSEVKCSWTCSNSLCQDLGVHFCLNGKRNCFNTWHSSEFDGKRLPKGSVYEE